MLDNNCVIKIDGEKNDDQNLLKMNEKLLKVNDKDFP
jgi:hypothetical protein